MNLSIVRSFLAQHAKPVTIVSGVVVGVLMGYGYGGLDLEVGLDLDSVFPLTLATLIAILAIFDSRLPLSRVRRLLMVLPSAFAGLPLYLLGLNLFSSEYGFAPVFDLGMGVIAAFALLIASGVKAAPLVAPPLSTD